MSIPPPKRRRMLDRQDEIIRPEAPSHTDTPSDEGYKNFVDLNFKVTAAFHKRFRLEATLRTMSLKDLFGASFQAYLDANGGTMEKPAEGLF